MFSEDRVTIRQDVKYSIASSVHTGIAKVFDSLVLRKPSVSLSMAILSVVFSCFWVAAAGLTIVR